MALPTKGRVIIDTTVGELDIELWSKEAPKTCRNFLALAMEGYYDGVIFHRVVPDFLVQTGDKTGTGAGGESFYGEPFEDEIHPRLRYAHRGLVGMANNGTKNSNDSQFFITLDRADELNGKHTLFGRCMGDTIFNVMKIGSMELDDTGRPLYPPKIKTIRIVDNPFDDIVPRITAAEKRAQQRAREQAQREREEQIRRKGAKKDTKLLSFQDDEAQEEQEPVVFKKKAIVRPDLVDNSDQLAVSLDPDLIAARGKSSRTKTQKGESEEKEGKQDRAEKPKNADSDIVGLREKHAKQQSTTETERQKQISKLEDDIRKLDQKRVGGYDSEEERRKKKPKRSQLEEELAKYEKSRGIKGKRDEKGKKTRDEGDILAQMDAFKNRLKHTIVESDDEDERQQANPHLEHEVGKEDGEEVSANANPEEESAMEVDNDTGFLGHKLYIPKDNSEEVMKAERDYEVIDPRKRSARAREEEKARKNKARPRDGGRGYRDRR